MTVEYSGLTIAHAPRKVALLLSALVALLGASVLAGWALDAVFLKSILPGAVTMKANTALGLLLAGVALALLSQGSVGKGACRFATVAACAGIALGTFTLAETFSGRDFGIDQWLFYEAPGAVESTSPGRMSPPAAFCLVLMGIALVLASRPRAVRLRIPVLSALSVTVILVGGLGLLGHLSFALFNIRFWNYTGLAMHTAAGLLLLGCALLAWVRSEGGPTWSLDALTTGGFVVGIVSIVAVAGIAYSITDQLRQDARGVAHSQEVLKEIQELMVSQKELTLSLGRYLITRDEASIAERARIKAAIEEDAGHIGRLTAGNPRQQSRIEEVVRLTGRRVALSDQIIAKIQQQALPAGTQPAAQSATNRGESPLGSVYPAVGLEIDRVLKEMEAEEDALLRRHLAQSEASSTRTFLLMPVGVYLSLAMLLLGLFVLNSGAVERKRAENELSESSLRFRQLAENIKEVFWLTDPAKNEMLYVSPAYEEIWGRSVQSLHDSPRTWLDAIHAEDRQRVLDAAVAKQARGDYDEEYRIVRADGSIRWIHDRAFPVKDQSGAVFRIAGVAEDFTERKRTAEELRESERRFSDMLGKVELVSLMLDKEARITYCNDYLLRLTGWKRDEVFGRNWFELFIPPDTEQMKGVFANLIADLPEASHYENEILTRSGARRLIRWNNSLLRSISGEVIGTASIGQDITEQKQAELRILGLNRVYAVLSGINALIVRVRDRKELFGEACRIAVEDGNFGMAWIGEFDRTTLEVTPVAWYGMDEGGTFRKASARSDIPEGQGMVGRAIRGKKPVITHDISADPGAGGPRRDEALRKGLHSIISMPLMVEDEIVATLTLFARERNFFNEDELKLLTELAGDISFALDHIEKADRLDYLAYYDATTGIANRKLLLERLDQRIRIAAEQKGRLALAILDIERFKNFNDTLGRHSGDQVLKMLADRFVKFHGEADRVGRVLGDQFGIIIPDVLSEDDVARRVDRKLKDCVGVPVRLGDSELRISARVGIAVYPDDGADADTLFRNAEAALKRAKASGERYLFYAEKMTERVGENLALESKLRQALENEEFVLHYQPKVDTVTRRIESVEALIRWQSRELGLVPPMHFIPLLEQTGLILEVGAWALRRAALDYRRWSEHGLNAPRIAVNVSPIQLRRRDFVESLRSVLGEGSPGIDLEITESLAMEDIQASTEKLEAARRLGANIAIDDFGTGYSSLAYLARLPVQELKIDRSFIITMIKEPTALTLVSTIVSMAHSLGLKVVAEGVDAEDQVKELQRLGCDQMQGYLFSKPVDFDAITALLGKPEEGKHTTARTLSKNHRARHLTTAKIRVPSR